ncbi:hypothetical protein LTR84_004723 [Exophiala bonariae]|uniref:BZIP domain-containing protein n=1 Tax=Exophiala bonariae TaxID=1690606 RepID=A0AAV9NN82_9EURO|nr:hypothetical protein LTR84_004723 [Exophiala bonariae]
MATAHSNSTKHARRRKIADLSEEQRERKRNTDRQAQQAFRERMKVQIQDLEEEVESMRRNATENDRAWKAENDRLRNQVRRLNAQLEQVRAMASRDYQPVLDLDNDHSMGNSEDSEHRAQPDDSSAGAGSPDSTIEVRTGNPEPLSQGDDQPLHPELDLQPTNAGLEEDSCGMTAIKPTSGTSGRVLIDHGASEVMPNDVRDNIVTIDPNLQIDNTSDILLGACHGTTPVGLRGPSLPLTPWMLEPSASSHSMSPRSPGTGVHLRREVHDFVCQHERTCPFDHILVNLLDAQRLLLANGSPLDDAVGPLQADVAGLFYPEKAYRSHPLSRVLVEMMQTFAHVELPERAAFMYKIHKTMRVSRNQNVSRATLINTVAHRAKSRNI